MGMEGSPGPAPGEQRKRPLRQRIRAVVNIGLSGNYDKAGVAPEDYERFVNETLKRDVLAVHIADTVRQFVPPTTPVGSKAEVLDIAAGTGIVSRELAKTYMVTATDVSKNSLEYLKSQDPSIDTLEHDMNVPLPFESKFDGVTTSFANRYIKDSSVFLRNIRRALKPGGTFVWPIFPIEIPFWKRKAGIRQPATAFSLSRKAKQEGFTDIQVHYPKLSDVKHGRVPARTLPIYITAKKGYSETESQAPDLLDLQSVEHPGYNPNGLRFVYFLQIEGSTPSPELVEKLSGVASGIDVISANAYNYPHFDEYVRNAASKLRDPEAQGKLVLLSFSSGVNLAIQTGVALGIPKERILAVSPSYIPSISHERFRGGSSLVFRKLKNTFSNRSSENRQGSSVGSLSELRSQLRKIRSSNRLYNPDVSNLRKLRSWRQVQKDWSVSRGMLERATVISGENDAFVSPPGEFTDIRVPKAGHRLDDYATTLHDYAKNLLQSSKKTDTDVSTSFTSDVK